MIDFDLESIQTYIIPSAAFSNFLCVAATKVVLFMDHFLINAARSLAMDI